MADAPRVGQIVEHYFLWQREQAGGRTEGAKPRPCVIVAVESLRGDAHRVTLVPITSQRPRTGAVAISVPADISTLLGLDPSRPAWIILDEANVFVWPGFDLVPLPNGGFVRGVVGRNLFGRVRQAIVELHQQGRFRPANRD